MDKKKLVNLLDIFYIVPKSKVDINVKEFGTSGGPATSWMILFRGDFERVSEESYELDHERVKAGIKELLDVIKEPNRGLVDWFYWPENKIGETWFYLLGIFLIPDEHYLGSVSDKLVFEENGKRLAELFLRVSCTFSKNEVKMMVVYIGYNFSVSAREDYEKLKAILGDLSD